MYNLKQTLGINIKCSSKFPPNSAHDLHHFLPWNVDEIVKMMDFIPMIMLHLWPNEMEICIIFMGRWKTSFWWDINYSPNWSILIQSNQYWRDLLIKIDKLILKLIWKCKGLRVNKTIWKNKNKVGTVTLQVFKTSYAATAIRHKDCQI